LRFVINISIRMNFYNVYVYSPVNFLTKRET